MPTGYLIISFLRLGSHCLFSVRSQQDKRRNVRQVKSVMRRCSNFHPFCISVKGQVRFIYHNITSLLGNEISTHHTTFHNHALWQYQMHVFYSLIQQFYKRKNSLQINVSKDVGCEAFVLLGHVHMNPGQ